MDNAQTTTCCSVNSNLLAPSTEGPIKLKNFLNGNQVVDTLHLSASSTAHNCRQNYCTGALMNPQSAFSAPKNKHLCPLYINDGVGGAESTPTLKEASVVEEEIIRSNDEILDHAIKFLDQYYSSIKKLASQVHKARLEEVAEQIRLTSSYHLNKSELIYGAKLAWRNTARCIGRIQWNKLHVFDARLTTTAQEMFEAICTHIKYATNRGNIRSAITIFPRRVKSVKYDYRVWNNQLLAYAGYQDHEDPTKPVIGDPINVEFTELCQRLGWRSGPRTQFDILPLVLSASGGLPQLFQIPEDIVLRVKLHHPQYNWFGEMGLEWFALPAVSNMMLDVGGLQFPAAPFNGWYMGTEIGTRDLCDTSRYNILTKVAQQMKLNMSSNVTLWKDKALVEVNAAVLYSFQKVNVTIVDHHTASETFMTHMRNEQKLRGGCPADWVWIVPPTGASTTEVFHQEMINYHLLPNYEYLAPAWKTFDWSAAMVDNSTQIYSQESDQNILGLINNYQQQQQQQIKREKKKYRLRDIVCAIRVSCRIYLSLLVKRVKCSILYATETGKSEKYATKLSEIFAHSFNVKLQCMDEYDTSQWTAKPKLQKQPVDNNSLLLVVTSTFGNGEPPENGESFARSVKALIKTKQQQLQQQQQFELDQQVDTAKITKIIREEYDDDADSVIDDDVSYHVTDNYGEEGINNVACDLNDMHYSVFALGSTSYPNFCAFGKTLDSWLNELGAKKVLQCECGDEMCGQEKKFDEWSKSIYRAACDTFNITCDWINNKQQVRMWSPTDVKFIPLTHKPNQISPQSTQTTTTTSLISDLISLTNNKKIIALSLENRSHCAVEDIRTISVQLRADSSPDSSDHTGQNLYEPGDHVAIYPSNSKELVDGILDRMKRDDNQMDPDQIFKILVNADTTNSNSTIPPNYSGQSIRGSVIMDEILTFNRSIIKKHSIVSGTSGYNSELYRENFSDSNSVITGCADQDQQPECIAQLHQPSITVHQQVPPTSISSNSTSWVPHDRLPATSLREALHRYLDITSGPSQDFLALLAKFALDLNDRKRLHILATQSNQYEEWKRANCPHLLHVLNEFKSIEFKPTLLTQLPLIQPRFYSISSSPLTEVPKNNTNDGSGPHKQMITLTIGLVNYTTKMGQSREGVCSNYLNRVDPNETIYGYIRSASSFHMPQTSDSRPMILVAAGTGIAPFRSFWEHKYNQICSNNNRSHEEKQNFHEIHLYFGCRNPESLLYKNEIDKMLENNVINSLHVAYSRSISSPKQYVQDKLKENASEIRRQILDMGAHVYVCGDVTMGEAVHKTMNNLLSPNGNVADETLLSLLREQNRYHEDIFGAKPLVELVDLNN